MKYSATFRSLLAALALYSLTGCAAYHSVPPRLYSDHLDRVVRIAFDQNGNVYPSSPNASGLPMPPQPANRNVAFDLADWYRRENLNYDRTAMVEDAADRIRRAAAAVPTRRVVFLIKGFNNSYASSDAEFAEVRNWLRRRGATEDILFVQIYWDSLYRGRGTAPAPFAYFADSMTYSNFAGMCGLRGVLGRLPPRMPITFLTHSRGAAVALSALAEPQFDSSITQCAPAERLPPNHLGDATLVAFAPALGDGHMRRADQSLNREIFDNLTRLYVGFNPNDYATSKTYFGIRLGGRRAGDTRLGSEDAYFSALAASLGNQLQRERLSQRDHGWLSYLADERPSRCLMWAGRLLRDDPGGCVVSR